MVFPNDAAETQRYYISNGLKKPNNVPIRQSVQHIQQLNSYLILLPRLYHRNRATKLTKWVGPFDDADVMSHILQMYLGPGRPNTSWVWELLDTLEKIKRAFLTDRKQPRKRG